MSVDILDMRPFRPNDQAIDVALPVLAIECEATPPLENFLDAYEETVLKLVSLGLSAHGISRTLNTTESLIEEILNHLEAKNYAERKPGRPWRLTEDGQKYLTGFIPERASAESQYGYMFINAIKKEVLPYFHLGNIGQISLFRGNPLPLKITVRGDQKQTFAPVPVKPAKLRKAYKAYIRNLNQLKKYDDDEISREEAVDLFADLESFDEEIEDVQEEAFKNPADSKPLKSNMFIRALNKKPENLYLRMRIVIDPGYPGGYRAESPFDFQEIDNIFFLKQMQWLEQADNAFLGEKVMRDFLHNEIRKLSPSYKDSSKDFQVFVLEKMPLLKIFRSKFSYVYEDMERIFSLIQRQNSPLEEENIVNNLARCVVEGMFNSFFRSIKQEKLFQIQQTAFDHVSTYGHDEYKRFICENVGLNADVLRWINVKYLRTILGRLNNTYGNSIVEKFVNMLVIEYHLSNAQIHKFLLQPNINQKYDRIEKLNQIRKKVSHDTDDRFKNEDYEFYISNVFNLINDLLDAFRED